METIYCPKHRGSFPPYVVCERVSRLEAAIAVHVKPADAPDECGELLCDRAHDPEQPGDGPELLCAKCVDELVAAHAARRA